MVRKLTRLEHLQRLQERVFQIHAEVVLRRNAFEARQASFINKKILS